MYWSCIETNTYLLLLLLWRCRIAWMIYMFPTAVVVGFLRRIALFEVHWEEHSLHFVQALSGELASDCLQAKSFLDSHFSYFLLSTPCDNKNACDMAITIVINSSSKIEPLWVECRYLRSLINNILAMSHFIINQSLSLYQKKQSCHNSF